MRSFCRGRVPYAWQSASASPGRNVDLPLAVQQQPVAGLGKRLTPQLNQNPAGGIEVAPTQQNLDALAGYAIERGHSPVSPRMLLVGAFLRVAGKETGTRE